METSYQSKLKSIDLVRSIIIISMLFANTVFFQSINQQYYIVVIVIVLIFTFFDITLRKHRVNSILRDKHIKRFLVWILFLFIFFMLHYYIGQRNKEMGVFGMMSQMVIVVCVILWLGDLPFDRAMYIFMVSATIASVLASVYVLFFHLGDVLTYGERLGSDEESTALRNINYVAQNVFLFASFTLYLAFFGEKKKKIYILLFMIQFVLVVLSGTKRAIIGLVVFYIILTIFKYRKSVYKHFIIIIFVIGTFFYLIINNDFLYNIVGFRIEVMLYDLGVYNVIGRNIQDSSTGLRLELFNDAYKMALDTPILGHGYAYFETHSVGFNSAFRGYHSHNNYLELIINYGLIGFILYYGIFIRTTFRLIRKKNKTNLTHLFLTFFLILYFVIEPSSVTYYVLPTYYLYLYFAYIYSFKRNTSTLSKNLLKE